MYENLAVIMPFLLCFSPVALELVVKELGIGLALAVGCFAVAQTLHGSGEISAAKLFLDCVGRKAAG